MISLVLDTLCVDVNATITTNQARYKGVALNNELMLLFRHKGFVSKDFGGLLLQRQPNCQLELPGRTCRGH